MPRKRHKKGYFTLKHWADAILRSKPWGFASSYISDLIIIRDQQVRVARRTLARVGLSEQEVHGLTELLVHSDASDLVSDHGEMILASAKTEPLGLVNKQWATYVKEQYDAESAEEISPQRWAAILKKVTSDPALALCVYTLAQERWVTDNWPVPVGEEG